MRPDHCVASFPFHVVVLSGGRLPTTTRNSRMNQRLEWRMARSMQSVRYSCDTASSR